MSARDRLHAYVIAETDADAAEYDRRLDGYRAEVLREEARRLRRLEQEMPQAGREQFGNGVLRAALVLDEQANTAGQDTQPGESTRPADFFQPGRTYIDHESPQYGWQFRCDTVTTHPENGELTALGWRFFKGEWEPYAYHQDDWEIGRCSGVAEAAEGEAVE